MTLFTRPSSRKQRLPSLSETLCASRRHGVAGVTTEARKQPLAEHDVVR